MAKTETKAEFKADRELRRSIEKGIKSLLQQMRREPRLVVDTPPEGDAPEVPANDINAWLFRR